LSAVDTGADFWARLPLGRGVALIHRDENGVAAFNKPAGVLSHPNGPRDENRSLLKAAYDFDLECYSWEDSGAAMQLCLLNRLDAATSGVILAAASRDLAESVRAQFKRREISKSYCALVFGVPRPPVQHWKDALAIDKRGGHIRTEASGRVPAESRMKLIRAGRGEPPLALLGLEPRTGRSHQLRVQCAKRGLAIVGDQNYGDFRRNREFARRTGIKRLFLHSLETSFSYERAGRTHAFSARAPLPAEFEAYL
jgi:23S rRNA-/tRNA-specific pseudouridylate synthase